MNWADGLISTNISRKLKPRIFKLSIKSICGKWRKTIYTKDASPYKACGIKTEVTEGQTQNLITHSSSSGKRGWALTGIITSFLWNLLLWASSFRVWKYYHAIFSDIYKEVKKISCFCGFIIILSFTWKLQEEKKDFKKKCFHQTLYCSFPGWPALSNGLITLCASNLIPDTKVLRYPTAFSFFMK